MDTCCCLCLELLPFVQIASFILLQISSSILVLRPFSVIGPWSTLPILYHNKLSLRECDMNENMFVVYGTF